MVSSKVVLQACRGSQLDPGQDMEVFQSTLDEVDGFPDAKVIVSPAPLFKDCLIMYATPPGRHLSLLYIAV